MNFNAFPDGLFSSKRRPDYILPYLQDRLRTNYSARVERRDRCVRINYTGDFHIDLVPAHITSNLDGYLQICDRPSGEFVRTDPLAYVRWVKELDTAFSGRFIPGIRMLKRWRDVRMGNASAPSSLHLTVLAGRSLEYYSRHQSPPFRWLSASDPSIEAFLWDVANSMRNYLDTGWFGCALPMPGAVTEDIQRTWPQERQGALKSKIETFLRRAEKALSTERVDVAVARWQENFGPAFIGNP